MFRVLGVFLRMIVGMADSEESTTPTENGRSAAVVSIVGLASYLDLLNKLGEARLRPIVDRSRGAARKNWDVDLT